MPVAVGDAAGGNTPSEFLEIKIPHRVHEIIRTIQQVLQEDELLAQDITRDAIEEKVPAIEDADTDLLDDFFDLFPTFKDRLFDLEDDFNDESFDPIVSFISIPQRKISRGVRKSREEQRKASAKKVESSQKAPSPPKVIKPSISAKKILEYGTPSPTLPSSSSGGSGGAARVANTPLSAKTSGDKGRIPVLSASKTKVLQAVPPSSGQSQRHLPRMAKANQPLSASKLPGSVLKKKQEEEAKRAVLLQQQLKEKEEKAHQQKQQLLQSKVIQHKMKREEKEQKVAMTREQLEREANEKRVRESAKKREADKKRREIEEQRKLILKKQEEDAEAKKKAAEEAAVAAAKEAARRAEEDRKAKEEREQRERLRREQEEKQAAEIRNRIKQLQLSKSSVSMGGKTSVLSTTLSSTSMLSTTISQPTKPANGTIANMTATIPIATNGHAPISNAESLISDDERSPPVHTSQAKIAVNSTFTVPEKKEPEKITSYDISDLNSGDESDDDRNPKKQVPDWAKGNTFVDSLKAQFVKKKKYREIEIIKSFGRCPTTIDLHEIFRKYRQAVIPRYERRTSSAIWSSPPKLSESFWLNASFSRSFMDTSIRE